MSIFIMDQVNTVMGLNTIDAVEFVEKIINSDKTLRPLTRTKAHRMILKQRNSQRIAFAMSNWILAHHNEGLKVI